MSTQSHILAIEVAYGVGDAAIDYLIRCLENLLLAEAGCCDVLFPLKELVGACYHASTMKRHKTGPIPAVRRSSLARERRILLQRKARRTVNRVWGGTLAIREGASRIINPPALRRTKEASLCSIVQS